MTALGEIPRSLSHDELYGRPKGEKQLINREYRGSLDYDNCHHCKREFRGGEDFFTIQSRYLKRGTMKRQLPFCKKCITLVKEGELDV